MTLKHLFKNFFSKNKKINENISIIPNHVAVIMDGNNRWAKKNFVPGVAGHKAGIEAIRQVLEICDEYSIQTLTLFAFSSENWMRPDREVNSLMNLFLNYLRTEVSDLNDNGVSLTFIGKRDRFSSEIRDEMNLAENLTANNTNRKLVIAVDYGGKWDILNATKKIISDISNGNIEENSVDKDLFNKYLSLSELPPVDLCIRTGGEYRISNFLLWQLAYTELYFTACLWPDFNKIEMKKALLCYCHRQRRYGLSAEQAQEENLEKIHSKMREK